MLEMVEDGHPDADLDFADGLMKEIPKLTKKIAGKSLPIEVSPCAQHWYRTQLTGAEIRIAEGAQVRITGATAVPACSRAVLRVWVVELGTAAVSAQGPHGTDRRAPGQAGRSDGGHIRGRPWLLGR